MAKVVDNLVASYRLRLAREQASRDKEQVGGDKVRQGDQEQ